jgi:DNA primase
MIAATGIKAPIERVAEQVLRYYACHPDMIVALLTKLGSERISVKSNQIRGTCPVHRGRNPRNFAVWFDRGIPYWRCMSDCADRGALTKLVMRKFKCPYEQAVVHLANLAGIQISGEMLQVSWGTLEEESEINLQRRLGIDAASLEQPTVFGPQWINYSTQMLFRPEGAAALDYLSKRKYTHDDVRKWKLGFVPGNTWKWFDVQERVHRGWFEDRLSFPWHSLDGQCMGFAGRRLDGDDHMKYKTLPGTKRALAIWGLHHPETQDAIRRTRTLVVVEGYTDAMRSHTHQCTNVGTVGGTELTPRQLDLIKMMNLERLVLFMDGDGPGKVATQKIAKQAASVVPVFMATPPGGKDPDELLDYNEFWTPLVQCKPFIPRSV